MEDILREESPMVEKSNLKNKTKKKKESLNL